MGEEVGGLVGVYACSLWRILLGRQCSGSGGMMNEGGGRVTGAEVPAEDEILVAWALRFDGGKYCEQSGWPDEERVRATDAFIETLVPPAEPLRQLTIFFMLQRHLFKWGGETLCRRSREWRAFRTLFLLTAAYEIDHQWRAGERYASWEDTYRGLTDVCVGVIARAHSKCRYEGELEPASEDQRALSFYDLESYLFDCVGPKFRERGVLTAFEFFSIVIWKANRAKSKIAKRLLAGREGKSLDEIVGELSGSLHAAKDDEERLRRMWNFGFRLPMASAALAVLWPGRFTVYDVRVCEQLRGFKSLGNFEKFQDVWPEYERYRDAVGEQVPEMRELRDKDRVLWARDAMRQLSADIGRGFEKEAMAADS